MQCNPSNTDREEWTEPLQLTILNLDGGLESNHLDSVTLLVVPSVKNQLLSERALRTLMEILENNADMLHQQVDVGNGAQESLLSLSQQLAEQSYTLACTKFDEPQLAILAVELLCLICQKLPSQIDSLIHLSGRDDLAHARVLTYGIGSFNLPLEGNFDNIMSCIVEDLRVLIQRRHLHIANDLVQSIFKLQPFFPLHSSIREYFKLTHLIAEHYLALGEHDLVLMMPSLFGNLWEYYEKNKEEFENDARPTKLCVARSLKFTGQLTRARDMFISCGVDDLDDLHACISGSKMCASVKVDLPMIGVDSSSFTSRELSDGTIALLFQQQKNADQHKYSFLKFEPKTGAVVECPLPHEGRKWTKVVAVQDKISEPLRLLVSPGSNASSFAALDNMSEMLDGISLQQRGFHNNYLELLELWEFRNNSWQKIKMRGCIPDRRAITRHGSGCSKIQDNLIVFGGVLVPWIRREGHSADVFMLNLRSFEWFRIPHPYITLAGPTRSPIKSLPWFKAVWTVEVNGCEMIAMLREGKPEVNHRRGNEPVPKFTLDLFEVTSNDIDIPEVSWVLDVPTLDRCGYIASPFVSCLQTGSTALVLGSKTGDNLQDKVLDMFALDMSKMQWRGINIQNLELLMPDDAFCTLNHLISVSHPDKCYSVSVSLQKMRICCISNLSRVSDSFTKSLNNRRKLSKKNSVSYQVSKARKDRVRPLRECASCHAFEHGGIVFKCCSRCRVPYYCSKTCQKRHWKAHHKHHCQESSK